MNATNMSMLMLTLVLIVFATLGVSAYGYIKEYEIKTMYKDKVEYALSGSLEEKFNSLDAVTVSKMARGDINRFSEDEMYNRFITLLNENFSFNKTSLMIEKYLDKYMILYNDGLIYNYENVNGVRTWSEKIPYTLYYNDHLYSFKLDSEDLYIDEKNIKQLAIISTLRRNLVIEMNDSISINIPYENNNSYNTIQNKTVIATLKNVPIINNKKINIACMSGNEIKTKNVYYINENNRYEKINPNHITEDMIIFETKKEAGEHNYPEI